MNKKYALLTLAFQVAVLPMLSFPVVMAAAFVVSATAQNNNRLSEIPSIYMILIATFVMLTLSVVCGWIVSRKINCKPVNLVHRYLPIYIPAGIAVVIWLACIVFSGGDLNSPVWLLYALKNPLFLLTDISLLMSGNLSAMILLELSIYLGFVLGYRLCEIKSKTGVPQRKLWNPQLLFSVPTVAMLLVVLGLAYAVYQPQVEEMVYGKVSIDELSDGGLQDYRPFAAGNKLAVLGGQPTLQFDQYKDMPTLDGATAAYPVYAAFVQAVYKGFANALPKDDEYQYDNFLSSTVFPYSIVQCTKTAGAYERLLNGDVDIIFADEPSNAQRQKAADLGVEFELTPIGWEAFVFFVNTRNPVEDLTLGQVQGIYSGAINNWQEVGGRNAAISPYQRPEDSGSQTIMQNKVMKGLTMLMPKKEQLAGGMGEIIKEVAAYKNSTSAIGYTFRFYSTSMVKNNNIKLLKINGIEPTADEIQNGVYPLTIDVYAVTLKCNSKENVRKFLDWMQSAQGKELVDKTGYVSVR